MTARARIKAALDTLDGVTAYEHEPANKGSGSAWPVLRELTRDGVLCSPFTPAYDVFVVLNNSHLTAAAIAAEDLIGPLVDALEELGEWQQPAELVQIEFDNSTTVPGLRVRVVIDPEETP